MKTHLFFRIFMAFCVLQFAFCTTAHAQFLNRLGNAAKRSAERATERAVERKTEQAVDKAIDKATDADTYKSDKKDDKDKSSKETGWTCSACGHKGNTGKFCTECGAKQPSENGWTCSACGASGNKGKFCTECGAKQDAGKAQINNSSDNKSPDSKKAETPTKAAEMAYAKSDFVPGDEIIFDDPMDNEQMGEFPSQWDLLRGNAEVASFDGKKCIILEAGTVATVAPLMKDMKSYLPDVFTIEFDYWVNNYTETHKTPSQNYTLDFYDAKGTNVMYLTFAEGTVNWTYHTPDGDSRYGNVDWKEKIDSWSHISVSFNKRAFKAYINGVRACNIPNMAVPARITIKNTSWRDHRTAITNFRIAKGAVPLYDRLTTDGKIITYGITFDVGKSTIKPESMGEINRIVTFMNENPDIKFSVEGHTDNTGNATTNQTLSEARSKAVMDKMIELGISKDRLNAAGKGQTSPIADNSTDEGRAKNRRVEFVKK